MTDDRGVKDMLAFNLARDTYHQQQWLLGIEQLHRDGFTDGVIEHSNGEWENADAAHVFYSFHPGEPAPARAVGDVEEPGRRRAVPHRAAGAADRRQGLLPPPDPKQFVTYDGSQGPRKPGDARGAYAQGAQNVVGKLKDALTPDN